jgi:thioredoxin 1
MLKVIKASASWCSPCVLLKKVFDKIKPNFADVDFEDLDIDDSPDLAQQMNIRAVPTILFIKDEQVVETLVGLQKEQILIDAINKWR